VHLLLAFWGFECVPLDEIAETRVGRIAEIAWAEPDTGGSAACAKNGRNSLKNPSFGTFAKDFQRRRIPASLIHKNPVPGR
jgi:hypothetical protein